MTNVQITMCLTYVVEEDVNSILLVIIQAVRKKPPFTFE
jgi:hypothetical protein